MDIFEFELRYLAYTGLSEKFNLNLDEKQIFDLIKRTDKGQLIKKLSDTTPRQLRKLTLDTYTKSKSDFIKKNKDKTIGIYNLNEYIIRLEYELKVIKEMGYNTYFLIVQDYTNRARENKISVGPGRGSAAGSLLSFLIGITDLDPLLYDLLFERFLNPARISMPDVDTDFEDTKRDKIIEYTKEKYGEDKVASIGTYMTMAAKASFKDVARVFGIKFDQANKISNLITEKTISKSLDENEEFKNMVEADEEIQKIVNLAIKLEGTIRQIGVHACGIIIAPESTYNYTPLQYPPKTGSKTEKDTNRIVSQYDGHVLEDIGLLKMDFLGLRNLSIIKNAAKIIKAQHESQNKQLPQLIQNYFDTMGFYPPLDNKKTYEKIFQQGDTSGVFQFESDGMKNYLKKLKPTDINDIIAMVALYRPGPMEFIPSYINRKHGKEKISYLTEEIYETLKGKYGEKIANDEKQKLKEDLSPFMDITYGIPIYQEQLMRIVQAVAGFSLGEADLLRRGVGKKIKEIIDKIKVDFPKKGNEFRGYKPETCLYVYEKMIEPAANYSFNKSHAACYAIISYQTAYLKANYPIQYNAALLRSVEEDTDKLAKFIDELKMQGYKILAPDINMSFNHFAAIENSIRIGFLAIKGVGFEVGKFIEEEVKNNGKFNNLEDFLTRCCSIINKKSIESLAKSGCLDELEDRLTILNNIPIIIDWVKALSQNQGGGLFDISTIKSNLDFKEKYQISMMEKLFFEYEVFNTFVSAHPLDGLYKYIKSKYNFISMFKDKEDYGDFKILGFIKDIRRAFGKGFFVTVEDITGEFDLFFKEMLDIKKFDLFIFKGYKAKTSRISQLIKINLTDLINKAKASEKYDVNENIMQVRVKRQGSNIELNNENVEKSQKTKIIEKEKIESNTKKDKINENNFVLPDEINKIERITQIIKNNKGNIHIVIDNNQFKVSEEGLMLIKKII